MEDNIIPTHIPSTSEATTTEYYSYKNKRNPYFMDIPIALRHPYSHTFSLIFSVVDIKSKKNANIKDIAPTIPTNTWVNVIAEFIWFIVSWISINIVSSFYKRDLTSFAILFLLSLEILGASFIYK